MEAELDKLQKLDRLQKMDKLQIRAIAELARLRPSESDEEKIETHLRKILEYVSKLKELDTTEASPRASVLEPTTLWREDAPKASLAPEESVRPAPDRQDHFFRVPRVLE